MMLQTVITVTDAYFVGNYVGENALAAINLGLPILYFYHSEEKMGKTKGDAGRKYRESRRKKSYLDVYNVCYQNIDCITFP